MEFPFKRYIVIVNVFCGLLSCSPQGAAKTNRVAGATEPRMAENLLTRADQGLPRDVAVGESVSLQLAENPSTGYRWSMAASPPDAVEIIETRWIAPAGGRVGAEGKREFRVRIKAPGEIRLNLKLWREWQGESSVIQRYEFILRAH
jgi:inhibitor of cysteine peptidase